MRPAQHDRPNYRFAHSLGLTQPWHAKAWEERPKISLSAFLVKPTVYQNSFNTGNDIITPVTGCSAWLQCPLALSGPKHHNKTTLPYLLTNQMTSQAD